MTDIALEASISRMRSWDSANGHEDTQGITDDGWRELAIAALGDGELVRIEVPNVTLGDYIAAKGAMFDASASFVDWEVLANRGPDALDAIDPAGMILLQIAHRLPS